MFQAQICKLWTHPHRSTLARLAYDCPDLETLDLSNCEEITKQGIESFLDKAAVQGKLKRLEIRDCDFLDDGDYEINSEMLKKDHPHIDIV